MTASPSRLAALLLGLFLSITLFGMLRAWAWAFLRLRRGKPLLEPSPPIEAPWTWKTIGSVVLSWVVVGNLVFLIYMVASQGFGIALLGDKPAMARDHSDSAGLMLVMSFSNLILLGLIPLLLRTATRTPLEALGIRWAGLERNVTAGVVGFLLTTPVVYLLNFGATRLWEAIQGEPQKHPLQEMIQSNLTLTTAIFAVISAVILAPATEELIFRGLIQNWLANQFRPPFKPSRSPSENLAFPEEDLILESLDTEVSFPDASESKGPVVEEPTTPRYLALIFTSILFGAVHFAQWPAPIPIFILSLGLGWLYERSGSLIAPFVMHALFNGLATAVLFYNMLQPKPTVDAPKPPGPAMQTHVHLPSIAAVHSRSSRP